MRVNGNNWRTARPADTEEPSAFWQGVRNVALFYTVGIVILVEIFRPALVQHALRAIGVTP